MRDTNIIGLVLGKNGEFYAKRIKVKSGDLLIKVLRKDVHFVFLEVGIALLVGFFVLVLPELDLGEGLVGER